MLQQLLKKFHVERWLLVALVAALLPGCMRAQQGLVRARQVVVINETPPGGAAVDLLIQDNSDTIVLQAGVNTGGQGNLVINSDAGPGFESVAIIGQEGATMIQLAENTAGGKRMSLGIETDAGVLDIFTGATQTLELSGSGGPSGDSTSGSLWMGDGVGNGGFDFYTLSGIPTLDIYDNANVLALKLSGDPTGGDIQLYEDSGDVAIHLYDTGLIEFFRAGTKRGDVGADLVGFGVLNLEDTSSRIKFLAGVGTGNSFLTLVESGAGSGNIDFRGIGTTPDLEIDFQTGGNGYPADDSANSWGVTGNAWSDFVGDKLTLDTDASAGTGEGAQLIRISKDGAGTIEADNFAISGDGNFYLRPVAGDASCIGIDDGWFDQNTTGNELQVCDGGATFLLPYIATSFTPLTLNCAASEVVIDPRWENGILVEGSCGAN